MSAPRTAEEWRAAYERAAEAAQRLEAQLAEARAVARELWAGGSPDPDCYEWAPDPEPEGK